MVKSRIGYSLILLLLLLGLFLSGWFFFLGALIILGVLPFLSWIFLHQDIRHLHVEIRLESGRRAGEEMSCQLLLSSDKRILATRCLSVALEIENRMFGTVNPASVWLELPDKKRAFEHRYALTQCGVAQVHCQRIEAYDMLNLWHLPIDPCKDVYTTVFPRKQKIRLDVSGRTIGVSRDEGMMQNKKGSDVSETFDLREYQAGDDIRAIHWKLSEKIDHVMVRQGSNPMRYQLLMLPDFGYMESEKDHKEIAEINGAVAIGNAIGEKLIAQGIPFCFALPTAQGLELYGVDNAYDWENALVQWLGMRMQPTSGRGLEYFCMENLERIFTKLILLSSGETPESIGGVDQHMDVLIVNSVQGKPYQYVRVNDNCEVVDIPAQTGSDMSYRILC